MTTLSGVLGCCMTVLSGVVWGRVRLYDHVEWCRVRLHDHSSTGVRDVTGGTRLFVDGAHPRALLVVQHRRADAARHVVFRVLHAGPCTRSRRRLT